MDVSCEIISGVVNELVQQNGGKPPTPAQLAEAMGLEVPEAKEILKELRNDGLLPPAAKTSKVMKRPAAAVIPAAEASPPAEASMPATPGNDLSGPKASENSDTAQGATVRKVPKRLRPYVAEKAVTPDEIETQEVEDTVVDEAVVESTQSSGSKPDRLVAKGVSQRSIGTVLRGQNLLRGASSVNVATSDDEVEEPDWAEWYQQQDRLPDQSPAPTEVPTPSPSPPRADELAVPEMAPPPQNDSMAPHATLKVTSTTHRREFMALGRVANGPRALEFPEVARMFNGTKVEQRKVLAAYVQSGENLAAIEANSKHVRTHSEKYTANRKLMTVKDMRDAGFSEAKILGCMARGGIADPDAPNCQESTKYWATTTTEHKIVDDDTSSVAMSSNINPQHALQAFNAPLALGVSPTVAVADPAALVRQIASRAPTAVTPQAALPEPVASARAKAKGKAKAKAAARVPGGGLTDVALAGKTVPEKCAMARGEIKKELSALGSLKLELPDLATRYGRYDEAMQQIDNLVKDLTTHFGRLPEVTDEDSFANLRSQISGLVADARMKRAELQAVIKEFRKGYGAP